MSLYDDNKTIRHGHVPAGHRHRLPLGRDQPPHALRGAVQCSPSSAPREPTGLAITIVGPELEAIVAPVLRRDFTRKTNSYQRC